MCFLLVKQIPDITLSLLSDWSAVCESRAGLNISLGSLLVMTKKERPSVRDQMCVWCFWSLNTCDFTHMCHQHVRKQKLRSSSCLLFGLSVCCLLLLTNRMFTGLSCFMSSLIRLPSQFLEFMCWWMSEMFWMLRKYLFLLLSSTSWKLLWVSFPSPWAPPCRQVTANQKPLFSGLKISFTQIRKKQQIVPPQFKNKQN